MFKTVLFQLHWLIGITAGLVLAFVGVTGGMLSFQDELLAWGNPGVVRITPAGTPLPLSALMARAQAAYPQHRVTALTLDADPTHAVRLMLTPRQAAPGGGRRAQAFYLHPSTGEGLGQAKGTEFFRTVRELHRWLAAGDVGKHIVGASTVCLIGLALSGLYLRWPRRLAHLKSWLALDIRKKGRQFLWSLHAVTGTWVLIPYLVMSLTGLYWSYDWYRDGLYSLTGTPRPNPPGAGAEGAKGGGERPARAVISLSYLDGVWATFQQQVGTDYSTVTVRLPERPQQPVQLNYLPIEAAHERATHRLVIDSASGTVQKHERYTDKPGGAQLIASMFALHSGSYWGVTGLVLWMLSSLLMPLFAITGWMLYLDRRKKKQAARRAQKRVILQGTPDSSWRIVFASQTGSAQRIAWDTAAALQASGLAVQVQALGQLKQEDLAQAGTLLFVVSTFGDGQAPDSASGFAHRVLGKPLSLTHLRFGLLALGDRQYAHFCGFGRQLDDWLQSQGAQALFDAIEMDNDDAQAMQAWLTQVSAVTGVSQPISVAQTDFASWRLVERRLLNPGSAGGPTYHLEFEPPAGQAAWQSGDLVEILPPQADGQDPPKPRRYSIASIPEDGRIHLLIRQVQHAGGAGHCSHWLTAQAAIGARIPLRICPNPGFHLPEGNASSDRPLILIGNGTGMAGLRSHVKARVQAGQHKNWLIFGERQAVHDAYYREEIASWKQAGALERVDWVFSRDQPERTYVQHRIRAAAQSIQEWIRSGAAIYVCGSAQGMAPEVDAELRSLFGGPLLETWMAQGRYRRDVY